jgi:hypothetical protein
LKIPVFVSAPTALNDEQEKSRNIIVDELKTLQFEARALGRSDYPADLPIREIYSLAAHCSGGIILGFSQFKTDTGIWKKDTSDESNQNGVISFPTPWNQLEAGILFGLSLPLLVFRESNISGGIFDPGAADVFVQNMPIIPLNQNNKSALAQVFLKWGAKVREHYYQNK